MDWTLDVLSAAVEAGARMDATFHPGIWRSVKYTCCDAINKYAAGCKPTTQVGSTAEMDVNDRLCSPPVPAPSYRKCKNTLHICIYTDVQFLCLCSSYYLRPGGYVCTSFVCLFVCLSVCLLVGLCKKIDQYSQNLLERWFMERWFMERWYMELAAVSGWYWSMRHEAQRCSSWSCHPRALVAVW